MPARGSAASRGASAARAARESAARHRSSCTRARCGIGACSPAWRPCKGSCARTARCKGRRPPRHAATSRRA
eukprot:1182391-Prymnesium_polylepis.1